MGPAAWKDQGALPQGSELEFRRASFNTAVGQNEKEVPFISGWIGIFALVPGF